jgi:hypothetical protein
LFNDRVHYRRLMLGYNIPLIWALPHRLILG